MEFIHHLAAVPVGLVVILVRERVVRGYAPHARPLVKQGNASKPGDKSVFK